MDSETQAPAGWYQDANNPALQQYWDGQQWTDARRPTPEPDKGSTALVVVGYITAVFLPIVGFILGIVLLVRRQTGHGLAVFLISIAVGVAGCALFVGSASEDLDDYSQCIENANTLQEMNRCD